MLSVLVFDDNYEYAMAVKEMVAQKLLELNRQSEIFCYASTNNFERFFEHDTVDVVFMDIDFKVYKTGIDVAQRINEISPRTNIIYMTSHNAYSADISDTEFAYYLLKPIDGEKLEKALKKTLDIIDRSKKESLTILSKGTEWSVYVKDIKYIESNGHNLIYHICYGEKLETRGKLDAAEKEYESFGRFIRTHKSYLVSKSYIKRISQSEALLFSGEAIPISKSNLKNVKLKFAASLMGEMENG